MEQGKKKALTKKQKVFLEILEGTMGVVIMAVRKVPTMSRTTHYRWMENPTYRAKVEEITENSVDLSEAALFRNIKKGDTTSIIFHLKTKGKARGYVEKTEVAAEVDMKVQEVKGLSDEELDARIAKLENKLQ